MPTEMNEKGLRKIIREEIDTTTKERQAKKLELEKGELTDAELKKLVGDDEEATEFKCNECGYTANAEFGVCPKCGAEMRWE